MSWIRRICILCGNHSPDTDARLTAVERTAEELTAAVRELQQKAGMARAIEDLTEGKGE